MSKKPEITIFERFQTSFDKLTHSDIAGLDIPTIDSQLLNLKSEIIELGKSLLNQTFVRGDYKELITLVLLYLDGGEEFSCFNRPGALRKAR